MGIRIALKVSTERGNSELALKVSSCVAVLLSFRFHNLCFFPTSFHFIIGFRV